MRKVIDRLTVVNGHRISFLAHLFMFQTLVLGVAFAFFGGTSGAEASVLYTLTQVYLPNFATSLWGLAAVGITVLNTVAIYFRNYTLARVASMGGFVIWLYAAVIYATGLFWLQMFVPAVVNMAFWGYLFIFVGRMKNN